MCTVTFLPLGPTNFVLTSNRDEQRTRITLSPEKYIENEIEMMYPKDKLAGGTWIGVSAKKRLVCVLNGAFVKHKRAINYSKSRGVIAKEILASDTVSSTIDRLDLSGVEPFTMVIVDWNFSKLNLFELIWDSEHVHFSHLENQPRIWSSSTLYTDEAKKMRQNWFKDWLKNNLKSTDNILEFHHSEIGDKTQSVLMKRSYVETVSITSVKKEDSKLDMHYEDVVNNTYSKTTF